VDRWTLPLADDEGRMGGIRELTLDDEIEIGAAVCSR
jgi:hypothetical protein